MALTIIVDRAINTGISGYCFPQEYRDDVNGKSGDEIYTLDDNALNSTYKFEKDTSGKWVYFRCSADIQGRRYYVNDNPMEEIKGEVLYNTTHNLYPFRFFEHNTTNLINVKVENMQLNLTRIFFSHMTIYNEWIPQEFDLLKYKNMFNYANANYNILLHVDFENYRQNNGFTLISCMHELFFSRVHFCKLFHRSYSDGIFNNLFTKSSSSSSSIHNVSRLGQTSLLH